MSFNRSKFIEVSCFILSCPSQPVRYVSRCGTLPSV